MCMNLVLLQSWASISLPSQVGDQRWLPACSGTGSQACGEGKDYLPCYYWRLLFPLASVLNKGQQGNPLLFSSKKPHSEFSDNMKLISHNIMIFFLQFTEWHEEYFHFNFLPLYIYKHELVRYTDLNICSLIEWYGIHNINTQHTLSQFELSLQLNLLQL